MINRSLQRWGRLATGGPIGNRATATIPNRRAGFHPAPQALWALLAFAGFVHAADDPYAAQLFQQHCAMCHEAGAGGAARIPQVSQLKTMTPTAILRTIESGIMKPQASMLSTNERQAVAN